MFQDVFQKILRFKNSLVAMFFFQAAVYESVGSKYGAAYWSIKRSYRIYPDDFSYVLLHGILAGIDGDTPVAAESFKEAFKLLERRDGDMLEVDREYLLTVATFWAYRYSWILNRSSHFKPIYEYYAERLVLKDVSQKWLFLFPAKFLDNWKNPAVFDKNGRLFPYSHRNHYPRYIYGGLACALVIQVIFGEFLYDVAAFFAGLVWVNIYIRLRLSK